MRKFTGTIDRWIIFCKVSNINGGNALAAVWDFDSGGDKTFSNGLRLSPTGQEPATHIGVNTVCDSEMMGNIENAITQGTPWLTGYKESDGFTWESAIADMGLKIIPVAVIS